MAASDLIQFKRGTLANLQALQGSGQDGCFYLTIDSGIDSSRLFIGRADGKIVPVNQGIVKATTVEQLEKNTLAGNFQSGDFAYVESDNILAVRSGNKWVQINNAVDTYADDFSENITVSGGVATITGTVTRNDTKPLTSSFKVAGANGITISATEGGVDASENPLPDTLTITGDTYTLSAGTAADNAAPINLASAQGQAGSAVSIKGGTNVTVAASGNEITLTAKDTKVTDADITGLATNGFELSLTQTENGTAIVPVKATVDPTIQLGDHSESPVHFVSGKATLDVYTKGEVDDKLQAVNAMVYKGTVGTGGTVAQSIEGITGTNMPEVHVGDTYKVTGDMTLSAERSNSGKEVSLRAGDLLIANGTETNGAIPAASVKYDVVSAGDDPDTTYTFEEIEHGIQLRSSVVGAPAAGSFNLANTDGLITLTDESGESNGSRTVTLGHSAVTRTNSTGTAKTQSREQNLTFQAVTGITTSAEGHVTGVETTSITVTDSNATLTSVEDSVSVISKGATVGTTVALSHGVGQPDTLTGSVDFVSDNLTVTPIAAAEGANPQVKMNFVWGTF